MQPSDRLVLAVSVAAMLASYTLTALTADPAVLQQGGVLVVLLGMVTLALRRARVGAVLVFIAQLLLIGGFVGWTVLSPHTGTAPWAQRLSALVSSGVAHMQAEAAPMTPNAGVQLIFGALIGVIFVITDLLAGGIRRPGLALLPLAALFVVPAIGVGADTGVASFICVAVGYLGILLADGLNSAAGWPRGLSADSALRTGPTTPVVWRSAGYLGGLAVLAAVVGGLVLPTLTLPGFGFGRGPGGSGPVQLTDPTLDLRRNLTRPDDVPVMTYRSDQPGGLYLRTASLPQFSSSGWSNVQMTLDPGNELPAIPGLQGEPDRRRTTTIDVLDLRSKYLPLPYAPRQFEADGQWAYDRNSLAVISTARDGDRATEGLTYTVESVDVEPSAQRLGDAVAGTPADATVTTALPDDFPDRIRELAKTVTARADSPATKSAAIQAYLRSNRFSYSVEQLPGSGYQALENFFFRDRRGYCEQFATAMAVMARAVDIPSRVAIGFLPGERRRDGYEVSAHDMHAWPELYFAGFGWVRYEPTPATQTGNAPSWTLPRQDSPETDPSEGPSSSASAEEDAHSNAPSAGPTDADTAAAGARTSWLKRLGTAAAALLVVAVLAAPATVRVRRRTARLSPHLSSDEQVESAWSEIRDSVLDYGGSWPAGSPRTIGGEMATRLGGEEAASMAAVSTLVEQSRYAAAPPQAEVTAQLPKMTTQIRRALRQRPGWGRQLLAVILPRSLFRRRR